MVLVSPEIEIPRRRAHGGLGYKSLLVGLVHADPKPDVSNLFIFIKSIPKTMLS